MSCERQEFVTDAAQSRLHGFATTFRRSKTGRSVIRTVGFNVAATAAAGLGGVILARTFGPTLRGEYAAITAWFAVVQMVGDVGQRPRCAITSPATPVTRPTTSPRLVR